MCDYMSLSFLGGAILPVSKRPTTRAKCATGPGCPRYSKVVTVVREQVQAHAKIYEPPQANARCIAVDAT
jgi:hypothetical protein